MRIDLSNLGLAPNPYRATVAREEATTDGAVQAQASAPPPPSAVMASASSGQTSSEEENPEKSLIEQILDGGFTKFVEEIEAKKREDLREKILKAMGLTQQDLENMPPEQRKLIEQSIADEIKRRMEAAAALRKDQNDPASMPGAGTTSLSLPTGNLALGPQMGTAGSATQVSGGMGLGPLLALQERDAVQAQENTEQHGKNDAEDS